MADADRTEVEALVASYLPALRSFVRLRMGRELRAHEESCDLVQSVAREVIQHADRFKHGGEVGFREWLFTTAHRKVINRLEHQRAEKRTVAREVALELPSELAGLSATPSQHASAREELARVEAAFDQLTEEQREVVMMSRLLGMSHQDIAARTAKTEVAVRKTLSRALARLSAVLAGDDEASARAADSPAG